MTSTSQDGYQLLDIDVVDAVATVTLGRLLAPGTAKRLPRAEELARALSELRSDKRVRVVVLTGRDDVFTYPPSDAPWHGDPGHDWDGMVALARALETLISMEKPVVAKVNGPAIGFGSSLVFASDFVVARADAIIADHHLAAGQVEIDGERRGPMNSGVTPGDGGAVFVPLAMSPALAKEYLILAKPWTAGDLARLGVINYAVPADELDAKTDELVGRILSRNPYAVAWTKRVINQRARLAYDVSFDASVAYEFLGFYMQTPESRERGGGRGEDRI